VYLVDVPLSLYRRGLPYLHGMSYLTIVSCAEVKKGLCVVRYIQRRELEHGS